MSNVCIVMFHSFVLFDEYGNGKRCRCASAKGLHLWMDPLCRRDHRGG